MSCANVPVELEAYADGELDLERDIAAIARIADHLITCADCRAEVSSIKQLSASLRKHLPRHSANDMLRMRVHNMIELANVPAASTLSPAQRTTPTTSIASARTTGSLRNWRTLALAAMALFAIVTAHDVATSNAKRGAGDGVNQDLISAHIRSLMSDHLVDVPSSDRHTVKPWFEGRINFSPAVFDFAADSFPLAGGRLDYATGHAMAAVVFHRGQHAINLFIWPSDSADVDVSSTSKDGYNISTWRRNHLRYSAVSTLNSGSLAQFAALYVARDSVTGAVQR
ncbi:MAG: hypothetical protein ABJB66_18805 [Gemmatimonadaceae bacterium]